MSFFQNHRNSPLPTTFEDAILEIKNLRRIMMREREILAKSIVQRECDNRASAGNIAAMREANQRLRDTIKQVEDERDTLEGIVKDLRFEVEYLSEDDHYRDDY